MTKSHFRAKPNLGSRPKKRAFRADKLRTSLQCGGHLGANSLLCGTDQSNQDCDEVKQQGKDYTSSEREHTCRLGELKMAEKLVTGAQRIRLPTRQAKLTNRKRIGIFERKAGRFAKNQTGKSHFCKATRENPGLAEIRKLRQQATAKKQFSRPTASTVRAHAQCAPTNKKPPRTRERLPDASRLDDPARELQLDRKPKVLFGVSDFRKMTARSIHDSVVSVDQPQTRELFKSQTFESLTAISRLAPSEPAVLGQVRPLRLARKSRKMRLEPWARALLALEGLCFRRV